jgi:hypothetical protein
MSASPELITPISDFHALPSVGGDGVHGPSETQSSKLVESATLAGVDHASFTQATTGNDPSAASALIFAAECSKQWDNIG